MRVSPPDRRSSAAAEHPSPAGGRISPAARGAAPPDRWSLSASRLTAIAGLLLLPLLYLLVPWSGIRPAAADVRLETSVDRDSVLIADPIVYTIEILAPEGLLVAPPSPAQQLGPFEVRDVEFLPDVEHDGPPENASPREGSETPDEERRGERAEPTDQRAGRPRRTLIRWTLVPYQTGRLEIPAVEIVVTDTTNVGAAGADTSEAQAAGAGAPGIADTLRTEPFPVEVASLEPDLQGDIRDIKPPEELPRGWAWLGWPAGGLILLAAGLWVLRRLRRRRLRRDLEEIPYQGPPRPAHRIALEELDRIAALHLLDKGMVKEHYIQVSDTVRRYAEGRYAIGAMELTTWELIGEMRRTAVPEEERESFRSFLEECDLVKFAKHIPPVEIHETLLDRARQLVLATRIPDRPGDPEEAPETAAETQPAGAHES